MENTRALDMQMLPQISFEDYHKILLTFNNARVLTNGLSEPDEFVVTSGVLPMYAFVGAAHLTSGGVRLFRSEHSRSHCENQTMDGVYLPRELPDEIKDYFTSGTISGLIMGGGLVHADRRDAVELLNSDQVVWLPHPNNDFWAHMIMGYDPKCNTIRYGYTRIRN